MTVAIIARNFWFSPTGWLMDTKCMQKEHSFGFSSVRFHLLYNWTKLAKNCEKRTIARMDDDGFQRWC